MIVSKYNYPSIRRVQTTNGRYYAHENDDAVPSVTTILDKTGDKSALIAWRERVGEEEANRISQTSTAIGTKVHGAVERHILGEEWNTFGSSYMNQTAKTMAASMIDNGFDKIDELYGVEVGIIAKGLYAGTSDAIGLYENREAIIDFKTSKKIKKKEWITDYFLQGCAYALAHNEMFGSDIKTVAILMVDRDGEFADFVIEDDEFEHYSQLWGNRLTSFLEKMINTRQMQE